MGCTRQSTVTGPSPPFCERVIHEEEAAARGITTRESNRRPMDFQRGIVWNTSSASLKEKRKERERERSIESKRDFSV